MATSFRDREVQEEAAYAAHHKKKIAFIFSAMMRSARELKTGGWRVDDVKLDDPGYPLTGEVGGFGAASILNSLKSSYGGQKAYSAALALRATPGLSRTR